MKKLVARFIREEEGQDLIEYVLIASFVSAGVLVGAGALGVNLNTWYQNAADWVADNDDFGAVAP
jgi:Flp pilus assembly pilin Flp